MASAAAQPISNSQENLQQAVKETAYIQLETAENVLSWYILIVENFLGGTLEQTHFNFECSDQTDESASLAFKRAIENEICHWENLMSRGTGEKGNETSEYKEQDENIKALTTALEKVPPPITKEKKLCACVVGCPAWEEFSIFYLRVAIKKCDWTKTGLKELEATVDEILGPLIKEHDLHSMLKDCEISQNLLLKLNNRSSSYISPRAGAEKCGLIYWTIKKESKPCSEQPAETEDESGDSIVATTTVSKKSNLSVEEKQEVETWMTKNSIRLTNRSQESFNGAELLGLLDRDLKEVKSECSSLVVFILAEGTEDYVYGVDHHRVALEKIKRKIQTLIPGEIPKVLIVCACQKPGNANHQTATPVASTQQPEEGGPDSRNYLQVMACTKGEKAFVHIMIPQLLQNLSNGMEFKQAVSKTGRSVARSHYKSTVEATHDTLHSDLFLKCP